MELWIYSFHGVKMYLISVEDHFESAHFLRGYRGKCEKLHGHRYKVVVRIEAQRLDKAGMAYDFTILKKQLHEIVGRYDHQCLNDIAPFDQRNPTAENIAFSFYDELLPFISKKVKLESIEIWESPGSCASYRP